MMTTRPGILLVALLAVGAPADPAGAQSDAPAEPAGDALAAPAAPALQARLRAGYWLPRLDGSAQLGPAAALELGTELDLDRSEDLVSAELTLRKNDLWEVRLAGFDFETETTGVFPVNRTFGAVTLSPGDSYTAGADISSVSVEVGRDLWRGGNPEDRSGSWLPPASAEAELRFTAFAGLRYVDIDQFVERAGVRQSAGGEWAVVTGGLDMLVRYSPSGGLAVGRALYLEAGLGLGPAIGGDGGWAWEVRATLTLDVAPGLGAFVGYRLLELNVEDTAYEFDGGLQGLFVGGSIRF